MKFFSKPSFGYSARLHDIRMINFTVSPDELKPFIPELPLVQIEGRPVISLLDVSLSKLRPSSVSNLFGLTYRHIAFRVLISDGHLYEDNINRGIFYVQSFTNHSFVANAGKMLTNFNFSHARFVQEKNRFSLHRGAKFMNYILDAEHSSQENTDLKNMLAPIDRAYSIDNDEIKETRVKRTHLPLTHISCSHFETNFFSNVKLLAAFRVKEVLDYQWLAPRRSVLQANFLQGGNELKFC